MDSRIYVSRNTGNEGYRYNIMSVCLTARYTLVSRIWSVAVGSAFPWETPRVMFPKEIATCNWLCQKVNLEGWEIHNL